MAEDHSEFAITMRGYDRLQVDQRLESLSRQLVEARNEVASLDHRAMTLAVQLAEAQRRLRESDKPTYAGLGSRIEQLLRNAEEQSASILAKANREADSLLTRTRTNVARLPPPWQMLAGKLKKYVLRQTMKPALPWLTLRTVPRSWFLLLSVRQTRCAPPPTRRPPT